MTYSMFLDLTLNKKWNKGFLRLKTKAYQKKINHEHMHSTVRMPTFVMILIIINIIHFLG